jgi:hypothetical protein
MERQCRYFLPAKKTGMGLIIFMSLVPAAGTAGLPVWACAAYLFYGQNDTTMAAISMGMFAVSGLFMLFWRTVRSLLRERRDAGRRGIGFTDTDFIAALDLDSIMSIPVADIVRVEQYGGSRKYRGVGIVYRDGSGSEKSFYLPWFHFDQSTTETASWLEERIAAIRGL